MSKVYKNVPVPQVSEVICDCCHKSCNVFGTREFASLTATWGYCSKKDFIRWECDLCEDCADKVKAFIESIGGIVSAKEYDLGI